MRKVLSYLQKKCDVILLVTALLLFCGSMTLNINDEDPKNVASEVGARLEQRMRTLEEYARKALDETNDKWLSFKDFPDDMVLYRYIDDSLNCWVNQFPLVNDDISSKITINRLWGPGVQVFSPLSEVNEQVRYMSLGSKWYLVKLLTRGHSCKVIIGLEICNSLQDHPARRGVEINSRLKVPSDMTVCDLHEPGGEAVFVGDVPVFKVLPLAIKASLSNSGMRLRWLAVLLLGLAAVAHIYRRRAWRRYCAGIVLIVALAVVAYVWGIGQRNASLFFSPAVYAGGAFFHSLGGMLVINLCLTLCALCTFMMRERIVRTLRRLGRRWLMGLYGLIIMAVALLVVYYAFYGISDIVQNSNIFLEIYVIDRISIFATLVYLSYTGILFCALLLVKMFEPVFKEFTGKEYDCFNVWGLAIFSALAALFFVVVSALKGFEKEQDRLMVATNVLAVDRDLSLEINLRGVEADIATDSVIAELSGYSGTDEIIYNRLAGGVLSRITQNYDISIEIIRSYDKDLMARYASLVESGDQIAEGSPFTFALDPYGNPVYLGTFTYIVQGTGATLMFLEITPKSNRADRGYFSIFTQHSKIGTSSLPSFYSYAKYRDGRLYSYRGSCPYPTLIDPHFSEIDGKSLKRGGYTHFVNRINEHEVIIASRITRSAVAYLISFSCLFLIIYGLLFLVVRLAHLPGGDGRNFFRTRINVLICTSTTSIMAVMIFISLKFVQERNHVMVRSQMIEKISTVQSAFDRKYVGAKDVSELKNQEFSSYLKTVSENTCSDICIYDPSGKVINSTTPEIFERRLLGVRMNQNAYAAIRYGNARFHIEAESFENKNYFTLSAPIINSDGNLLAIISTPYLGEDYDFKQAALSRGVSLFAIFLLLLWGTIAISSSVVNSMFKPIMQMGEKMASTKLHGMEYIIYRRSDEISALVDAYNRMVHDLSESTKRLTRSERDKAWSEMARQVAHEIKNPLTPIKLEIQRLIRLKERNDPNWESKFDKISGIILEHIDILADTANEFSTFAKLYSEPPVEIDLDRTLGDQIAMFDNREGINITYFGLEGAMVMAPRPQLIRVFVNIISNAVQALEIAREEAIQDGREVPRGEIAVSLRISSKEGCYDVVVEDNGPGVGDENLSRLFTPNFTTKSGGTGLGLAICRNIVEKCNGEISYRRSFSLGGACFTVTLPKKPSTHTP